MSVSISARLLCAAEFVRRGSIVADIGTDHAYLPIYLIQNGLASHVYACDIRQGPLDNAAACIRRCLPGDDRITLLRADGMQGVPDCDDYVIAGMGGQTICGILQRASSCICSGDKRLILQPMTARDDLRRYLYCSGFEIVDERVCSESQGKFYCVICAEYTGRRVEYRTVDLFFSPALRRRMGEADVAAYHAYMLSVFEKAIGGIKKSVCPQIDILNKYEALYEELRGIVHECDGKRTV